jgi:hypothetical protein
MAARPALCWQQPDSPVLRRQETPMRAALFAVMAIGTISAIDMTPAEAAYGSRPFCMRTMYDDDDCSYMTYQQCATTASGIGLTCFANPALAYNQQQYIVPAPLPRRHRHRSAY